MTQEKDGLPEKWLPFVKRRMPDQPAHIAALLSGEKMAITGATLAQYLEGAYASGERAGARSSAHAMALLLQKVTAPESGKA